MQGMKRLLFFCPSLTPSTSNLVARSITYKTAGKSFGAYREIPKPKITLAKPGERYEPEKDQDQIAPKYEFINIDLYGFDFQVVEKYQSYIHKLCNKFKLIVNEAYAVPAKNEKVLNYKPGTKHADFTHFVNTYRRTIQLKNVQPPKLQTLTYIIRTNIPIGVRLVVKERMQYDDELRFIPNYELLTFQKEYRSFDEPSVRARNGWLPLEDYEKY